MLCSLTYFGENKEYFHKYVTFIKSFLGHSTNYTVFRPRILRYIETGYQSQGMFRNYLYCENVPWWKKDVTANIFNKRINMSTYSYL